MSRSTRFRNRSFAWALALAWAASTWFLLVTPPPPPEGLPAWLPWDGLVALPGIDKAVHAALFFVQAALVGRALPARSATGRRWALFASVLAATAWGAATELSQRRVPGRDADPLDLLADFAGALAYAATAAFRRRWRPDAP